MTDFIEDILGGPQFEGHRATDVCAVIAIDEDGNEGLASIGGIDDSVYPAELGLPAGSVVLTRMPLVATAPQMVEQLREAVVALKQSNVGGGKERFILRRYTFVDEEEL